MSPPPSAWGWSTSDRPPGGGPSPLRRVAPDRSIDRCRHLDASILAEAGFDALIVENFGDEPFFADDVPKTTVAAMTRAVAAVRDAVAVPVGVNVLRNDAMAALAVAAATGRRFHPGQCPRRRHGHRPGTGPGPGRRGGQGTGGAGRRRRLGRRPCQACRPSRRSRWRMPPATRFTVAGRTSSSSPAAPPDSRHPPTTSPECTTPCPRRPWWSARV